MSNTKRQHYIPKFYLRNFAIDKEKNLITQYILDKKKITPKASIKSVACEDFIYGEDASLLEDHLAENEKRWSDLLGKIVDGTQDLLSFPEIFGLNWYNLVDFLFFILSMDSRTLYRVNQFKELIQEKFKTYILKNGYDESKAKNPIDELHPEVKMADGAVAFDAIMPMCLKNFAIGFILDLRMVLIVNNTTEEFITSDAPVVRYNQFCTLRNVGQEMHLTSIGMIVFFPITPKICVCLYDDTAYDAEPQIIDGKLSLQNEDDVNNINRLIAENAYQYIYCRNHAKEYLENLSITWVSSLSLNREVKSKPIFSFLKLKQRFFKYRIPINNERWIRKTCYSGLSWSLSHYDKLMKHLSCAELSDK